MPSTTVARMKNGDLMLKGEVDERIPNVMNALHSHYPFDCTYTGVNGSNNLANSEGIWIPGTSGAQGPFGINGSVAENQIIIAENPWGMNVPIWATLSNDVTSDSDGGWNRNNIPIDNTKKYRFSVWFKRVGGVGSTYFGCGAGTVYNLGTTTENSNPYFGVKMSHELPGWLGNWFLWVAHIHPAGYAGGTDPTSGIYGLNGNKLASLTDFKWAEWATVTTHRAYFYYSTTPEAQQFSYDPRVELTDGSEPPISNLLMGNNGPVPLEVSSGTLETTGEGLSIEVARTNLVSNSDFSKGFDSWNGWGTSIIRKVVNNGLFGGKPCFHHKASVWNSGISTSVTVTPNTTYTLSMKVKQVNSARLRMLVLFSGIYNEGYAIYPFDGYDLYVKTFTSGAGVTTVAIHLGGGGDSTLAILNEAYMTDVMLEQASHSTAHVEGFRKANAVLFLSAKLPTNSDFTITGEWLPNADSNTLADSSTTIDLVISGVSVVSGTANASNQTFALRAYPSGNGPYIDGNRFWSDAGGHNVHKTFNTKPFVRVRFIIRKQGTSSSIRLVSDDGQDVTWTLNGINYTLQGYKRHGSWGGTYRDTSIYTKALTDEEINKFLNTTLKISPIGNLLNNVNERLPIPKDNLLYFPLDNDGCSEYGEISPSRESNVVYNSLGAWVGAPLINYVSALGGSWRGSIEQQPMKLFGVHDWWEIKSDATGGGLFFRCSNGVLELATGAYATTSTWIRRSDAVVLPRLYMQGWWNNAGTWVHADPIDSRLKITWERWFDVNGKEYTTAPQIGDENWYNHIVTFHNNGIENIRLNSNLYYLNNAFTSGSCYISLPQLQQGYFASPYVLGSRAVSHLEFNLYRDYDLNWNNEWSIVYWKRPVGTASSAKSDGYDVDSLGSNGNTVGGGYVWWGKISGDNKLYLSNNGATPGPNIDPLIYYNNWHMVGLVKKGAVLTITWYNCSGVPIRKNSTYMGTVAANIFVTGYDYDLRLGGYDGANSPNSYYKDLIVAKRSLTDTELNALANSSMQIKGNKVNVGGTVLEGLL